jgi:NTP pyrophosphatase (non-canonical NTP hydrolase)
LALTKEQQLKLNVVIDLDAERNRQDSLWGKQRHALGVWLMILGEEYGEVCQAMQQMKGWGKDSDASDLYTELIQLAAVAVAIAEQVREEREKDDLSRL